MKTETFDNELRSIENVIEDRNFKARESAAQIIKFPVRFV